NAEGIEGVHRFLNRVWTIALSEPGDGPRVDGIDRLLHRTIAKVTADVDAYQFNTAIAAMMELTNELQHAHGPSRAEATEKLLLMLAPFAPYITHALVGQDGKVSLMGIFRNISVSGLPAQHPRMFVVVILGLDVGAHTVRVRLLRPDGQQAMPNPPEISVHAVAGQDVNVIVELNNMSFTSYGVHKFDLEVDGSSIGGLPVAIVQMQQQQQGRRTN